MEEQNKKEITFTRILDLPREVVFNAWIDPLIIKQWWGPNGVSNQVLEWDSTPGGIINLVMSAGVELGSLSGQQWPMGGQFIKVDAPSIIIFTANASANGKEILEHQTTVTFEDENGKTKMTVHVEITKTTPEARGPLQGMETGWNQQLDKLVSFLAK